MINKALLSVGLRGSFTLLPPFNVDSNVEYTISGVYSFTEVRLRGMEPFQLVYAAKGLTQDDRARDEAAGCVVVRLSSLAGDEVYVTNHYIHSIPIQDGVGYQHVVLGVSLGALPETIDVSHMQEAVVTVLSDYLGYEPEAFIGVQPTTGVISSTQHRQLETARAASIANRKSLRGQYVEQVELNAGLQQRIRDLELMVESLLDQL